MYLTGNKNKAWLHLLDDGTLGLLNTPAIGYVIKPGWTWAADNGCYNPATYAGDEAWFAWLGRFTDDQKANCLFATAPDVVGDHEATLVRSLPWLPLIRALGYPAAFVLQDGATEDNLPWDEFDVLFIGGSTEFKLADSTLQLIAAAKRRGKGVHVGRVNSRKRFMLMAAAGADSVDGTYLGFGPQKNLPKLLAWVNEHETQGVLC